MQGQWLGTYSGSVDGTIMINIDKEADHFAGVAYITPTDRSFPSTAAHFRTEDNNKIQETTAYLNPIHPHSGHQGSWDDIKELFGDDVDHAKEARVQIKLEDDGLHINAKTDIGGELSSILPKPENRNQSKIVGQQMSWKEFQALVPSLAESTSLYRGQSKPWPLRSAFHRGNRYRISEFTNKDVKQLHRKLSALTNHYFDLNIPDQNGAFFNLLQHHGYPTPLLDWSYSPYVASFFAFRERSIDYQGDEFVRIYAFNNEEWQKHYRQIFNIDPPFPHLSVSEFIAIDNPRLIPQQAVTTATNIDDIEAYILERQAESGKNFIVAIDIPTSERANAMRDLRLMGITAGSMFPGVEGVCEDLREKNFSYT